MESKENFRKVKQCYYFLVSFMCSDKPGTRTVTGGTVCVESAITERGFEKFPLMGCIRYVEKRFKGIAIPSTIQVQLVCRISEEDRKEYDERMRLYEEEDEV